MIQLIYFHGDLSSTRAAEQALRHRYGVVTTNWRFDALGTGIGKEFLIKVYDDYGGLNIDRNTHFGVKPEILYISPDSERELDNLLRVVSIFNLTLRVSCTVYCSVRYQTILAEFANESIRFIYYGDSKWERFHDWRYHVVITHGSGAVHFLKQDIPVLLLGHYGYSGLITPGNFTFLKRDGFSGKAGGANDEKISAAMVIDEILSLKDRTGLDNILSENTKLAQALPNIPLSGIQTVWDRINQVEAIRNDETRRWGLYPKVSSNMELVEESEDLFIKRRGINDTLMTMKKSWIDWLLKMDGGCSCRFLYTSRQMQEAAFWNLMNLLSEKKIISFYHVPSPGEVHT
jgi:hypothetical protein